MVYEGKETIKSKFKVPEILCINNELPISVVLAIADNHSTLLLFARDANHRSGASL